MGTVVHAGSGAGVVAAAGGGAESGRIALGPGEHQPETGFQAGLRGFSMVPGAAAYGRSACSASAVISGTLMSGASTGGTAIASTGGTASGPAADGRPSMAASALGYLGVAESRERRRKLGSWPGGRHFLEEPEQLNRYRHDQRAVLLRRSAAPTSMWSTGAIEVTSSSDPARKTRRGSPPGRTASGYTRIPRRQHHGSRHGRPGRQFTHARLRRRPRRGVSAPGGA